MAGAVRGGGAIGVRGGHNGTLGCLVSLDGEPMILGSSHVMAVGGAAQPGDAIYALKTDFAIDRQIGALAETSSPIDFSPGALNGLDAALARLSPAGGVTAGVGSWSIASRDLETTIAEGDTVLTCGAVSGEGQSTVVDPNAQEAIEYDDGRTASFSGLVRCEPAFSRKGDSGAAVLNNRGLLVGLIVGGGAGYSLFCPSRMILERWPGLKAAVT